MVADKVVLKEKAVEALSDYIRVLDTMPPIPERTAVDWRVLNELDDRLRVAERRYNHHGVEGLDAKV